MSLHLKSKISILATYCYTFLYKFIMTVPAPGGHVALLYPYSLPVLQRELLCFGHR